MKLHPDWPAFEYAKADWDYPVPICDLVSALEYEPTTASVPSMPINPISIRDVQTVDRYYVSYHGTPWPAPDGDYRNSELEMVLYGRLKDGRWYSVNAWNDYTGWGCRDNAQIRIGVTEEDIIAFGLDKEGRARLGIMRHVNDDETGD